MRRLCTNCGADFEPGATKRRTCSDQCARARRSAGGLTSKAATNRELGRLPGRERPYMPAVGSGAGRSVVTERGFEVVDPAAMAAAGVRLAERRGREWAEWVPL